MKDLKLYIFLASALLVFYIVAQYNKPKPTDWSTTLVNTDKIPFGTYILYNRVDDIFPGAKVTTYREPVYNVINDEHINNSAYIIIAQQVNLNKFDYQVLTKYIEKGNDVFIAAESFGPEIFKELGVSASSEYRSGTATRIGFVNKKINTDLYDVDKGCSDGTFANFNRNKAIVLGKNEYQSANYLKFPMGKGNLYLNANPMMFTNYSLLQDMGSSYASIALSYLKNQKLIVWDEYYTQDRAGGESPMRVFLNNYQLRWAFYIAFFTMVVFVLYEMKRRQRIIPVIEPLANTTVEFANVVGQVYYEQRNNSNIAQKKVAYFLEHIRAEYNMRTNVFDDEFVDLLTRKSGADPELVKRLIQQVVYVRVPSPISNNDLISLNQNIEQFYTQSS
ncbi:DUF4350 domain-containing protein [Mucilaginibacter sp.]